MNKLSNSFTDDDLRSMIVGNNPVSNAYRELLAYREAQGKPVVIVEESDYLTVAQMTGKEPRQKAVRELYEGALIVGSKLYSAPQLPVAPEMVPVPDEFLSSEQNESGMFELSEDCMTRLAVALSQQSKGIVIPVGKVLVPIEATPDMLNASWIHHGIHAPSAWRAMLAAAPKPNSET